MNTSFIKSKSKLSILILLPVILTVGCKHPETAGPDPMIRFDKLVFTSNPATLSDTIRLNHPSLIPFFTIFNEEVVRIGPDSLPGYSGQLNSYINDSVMRNVFNLVDKSAEQYQNQARIIAEALKKWETLIDSKQSVELISFISGFNQSFITLPGCLGIGLDNYLGSDCTYYKDLAIPVYKRKNMNPGNMAVDAVRAWLYSELPQPATEGGVLDRMIYEGKLYYIASRLLPQVSLEELFHYSDEQIKWCKAQENAMWKYLAEQKILFSTDRLTIRKFIDEAPFTRDFGPESPGRVGTWIGYRIVSSYMKSSGTDLKNLIGMTSAKEILSASKYHP